MLWSHTVRWAPALFIVVVGCGAPAPPPPLVVTNAVLTVPKEVSVSDRLPVTGSFELSEGYEELRLVYLEVVQLTREGKKVIVFNCNVKGENVSRLGTKLSYEVQLEAPTKTGDYQIRARCLAESAGEAEFKVRG